MSNQLQIESYRISKWWQNHVFTEAWRDCHNRTIQACGTDRLFIQPNWLFMHKPVRMWHAYIKHRTFWFTYQNRLILYLEWCKHEILSNAYTKTFVICNAPSYCVNVFSVYRPTVFSGSRVCSATLFAVSRWKRACSRTANYGKECKVEDFLKIQLGVFIVFVNAHLDIQFFYFPEEPFSYLFL